MTLANGIRTVTLALLVALCSAAPANAGNSQASSTIFYSGGGHAGENSGKDAGAYVMVEEPYKNYEVWKGTSTCNSNRSVPRRPSRTFTRLVGYSKGRLGPAYYLQQMEQRHRVSAVRSVILLDPGVASEFVCDNRSGAGYTYATWLRQNPSNRLLIVNGAATAADKYRGLRDTYLSKLTSQTVGANVGDRVLVCDAPTIKHSRVDEAWKHLIGARAQTSCPPATTLSPYSPRSVPGATSPPQAPESPGPASGAPRATLGQGPAAPYGYRYAITVTGFPGGSSVTIVCRDSVDPSGFYTFQLGVDAGGYGSTSGQCYSGDGPDHWITANGVESNHVIWGASPQPQPQPPSSARIVVDNRVTNGASVMREDTPAYLSTVTRNYCKRDGCALASTDVGSGAALTAECTVLGDRTTNGQDNSAIDDGNPGLYSSTRWYGIRWHDGRFGYISEVWIASSFRGGLGLRSC